MTGKQQKTLIAAATIVMAAAGVIWFTLRETSEPKYQGKSFTFWIMCVQNERRSSAERAQARCAIETLGTNNLRLLLKWLHEPEPEYREPGNRFLDVVFAKLGILRTSLAIDTDFRMSHPATALRVLSDFPVVSRLALPHLTNMFATGDIDAKQLAAYLLGRSTEEAIPSIIPFLSSKKPTNRALTAYVLGEIGKGPELVIPKLNVLLKDPIPMCRMSGVAALLKLNAAPEPLLPIVIQGFHGKDKEISAMLVHMHTNMASLAVSPLIEMITAATNREDRQFLYSTLRDIDQNAAEEIAQRIPELQSPREVSNSNDPGDSPIEAPERQ